MRAQRPQLGFTLVEMIVVLVLVAAVVAIGATAMSRKLPGQRLQQSAREVAAQLRGKLARRLLQALPGQLARHRGGADRHHHRNQHQHDDELDEGEAGGPPGPSGILPIALALHGGIPGR